PALARADPLARPAPQPLAALAHAAARPGLAQQDPRRPPVADPAARRAAPGDDRDLPRQSPAIRHAQRHVLLLYSKCGRTVAENSQVPSGRGTSAKLTVKRLAPWRRIPSIVSVTWAGVPTRWMSPSGRVSGRAFTRSISRSVSAMRMPTRTTCPIAS